MQEKTNKLTTVQNLKTLILLFLMSGFCITLSFTRIFFTGTTEYLFLNWNLFLALIPWVISFIIVLYPRLRKNYILMILFVSLWLIFFPNSPYILTDLFHLRERGNAPLWFDLIIILAFAWTGLIAGFQSLSNIEVLITGRKSKTIFKITTIFLFFLVSFGVYLGRYQRWNSWDIINNPFELIIDIADRLINPFGHARTWGVTILMGILLNMIYWSSRLFFDKNKIS